MKTKPKTAAPNYILDAVEAAGERLSDLDLEDALDEMTSRCVGLRAAIKGAEGDKERDGVFCFANDISDGMERLAEAFSKERQLREAEGR
jgi:hypothetical protein